MVDTSPSMWPPNAIRRLVNKLWKAAAGVTHSILHSELFPSRRSNGRAVMKQAMIAGVVAPACNPSTWRRRQEEPCESDSAQATE